MALKSATSVPGCICRWMSARPASSVLRGSATMSVAPRSGARLMAAPNTGCDSVVFAPAMKMTSAECSTSRIGPEAAEGVRARRRAATGRAGHRLAHRARRAGRLRVLALPLDGLPRPAPAIRTAAPAPDPAALLLLPALADQRLREAIVVLGKVVAEPALHAGRALVGSVELDV